MWLQRWAARATSGVARPRCAVRQMAGAAGRATRRPPAPLDEALAQEAAAELKDGLTALHEDKLSGSSSDGAIRIIARGG